MTGQKWNTGELGGYLYARQLKNLLDNPAPPLYKFIMDGRPVKPVSRWRRMMNRLSWRIESARERLGEIIAGRRFDDG